MKKAFMKAMNDYLSSEDFDLMNDEELDTWEAKKPIPISPKYVMYKANDWVKSEQPVWCLYQLDKFGAAQSIGLYCEGTEQEAIEIYKEHIDILPNRKCYMGITITKKDKKNIS